MAEWVGLPVKTQTRCRSLIRTSQGIYVTTGAHPRPRVVSSCAGIEHMSRGRITAVRYQVRQYTTSVLIITQRIALRFFSLFWDGRVCQFGAHQKGNTQNHTHTHTPRIAIFRLETLAALLILIDVFPVSGVQNRNHVLGGGILQPNTHVFLYVRAHGDSPVSLAMTHMRRGSGPCGHERTNCTRSVVLFCLWLAQKQTGRLETSLGRQHTS